MGASRFFSFNTKKEAIAFIQGGVYANDSAFCVNSLIKCGEKDFVVHIIDEDKSERESEKPPKGWKKGKFLSW